MKKTVSLILIAIVCLSLTSCAFIGRNDDIQNIGPEASQMKTICELATMQCYFHNVAKYNEKDAVGVWPFKKDRNFWVEYSGVVTIGIDTSLVTMDIEGDVVTIAIPPAKVLGCKVDETSLTADSFIIAKDSAKVEAEHQTKAFKEAQANMRKAAEEDRVLLANAQQRAMKLLEDYVLNIGSTIGKTYAIEWNFMGNEGNPQTATTENQS